MAKTREEFRDEVLEVIGETIAGLEANCRLTLFDIYGSVDGFYIAEYKVQAEENAEYEKPARMSDYTRCGDQLPENAGNHRGYVSRNG